MTVNLPQPDIIVSQYPSIINLIPSRVEFALAMNEITDYSEGVIVFAISIM